MEWAEMIQIWKVKLYFNCLIYLFILFSFTLALSIKCYVCTDTNANCKTNEMDCGSSAILNRCMKITSKDSDGVVKSCSSTGICDTTENSCGSTCSVSCCEGDLCNAGTTLTSFTVITIVAFSAVAYYLLQSLEMQLPGFRGFLFADHFCNF